MRSFVARGRLRGDRHGGPCMKIALRNNKDFLAGLMFIGIGVAAFVAALDYPFGSTLRMGPGYFPRVLAGIMIVFGIAIVILTFIPKERACSWPL